MGEHKSMGNKVEKKNGVPSVEHSCTEENKHSVLPHVHVGPTLKYHRLCNCKGIVGTD